ncbi:MAG: diaminopimelate epimerase [Acidiferrobacterales bacterium]|nr:diaminopimelate epimerase [Acidiferrobacterales bacterium]
MPFTKMHGLGNDFVVFDFTQDSYSLSAEQATKIADRNFGIGCDQILIIEQSDRVDMDFKYRILNADGSEVGQCGNGSRCFALYVHQQMLSNKNPINVETITGDMMLNLDPESQQVTVTMPVPRFLPVEIPLDVTDQQESYSLLVDNQEIEFFAVSVGNPHAVILVEEVEAAPVASLGPILESHPAFPERANIGFMQIINAKEFALRVYERGVGETIACGSGACAAALAGIRKGRLDKSVTAHLTGGDLNISWQGEGNPVMMTGPAERVFDGIIEL